MLCKKCGNEIKEGESFCSKCGKRVKQKEKKKSKKLLYIILGIIILVIIGIVGIALTTNKNTETLSNTNTSQDTNNNDTQNQEKQDFKYVQEDSKSYYGKSFKNVDFESFKNNLRKSWFKESLEYDTVMARNKGVFGEQYSQWQMHKDSSTGGYMEEIIFPYLKGNSYIIGKMVDIYYNNDKTNVYGVGIYISDYYLGKIGRSKFLDELDEVINCLPSDFKDEVNKRSDGSSTIYEDFNVGYNENVKLSNNEKYYLVNIMCAMSGENTNNSYTTNNAETSNKIEQTNGIRQNVKYTVKEIEAVQNENFYGDVYIQFNANRFELAYFIDLADTTNATNTTNIQLKLKGTYVESGNNSLTLNCDKGSYYTNVNGETMNVDEIDISETLKESVINGKILNDGKTVVITMENEELKFEL